MLAWLKSKWLLLGVGLILLIGAYALIGFKLVPKIIRSQAMEYAKTELKKPLTLGEIAFNPFSFELHMRDIALQDQGKPLLSLKHLFIDFQASSVWKRAYVFNAVQLEKPFARAIIKPDGSLNLADLLPKEKDDSPIPNIWINDLSVQAGQVNFADQSRELKPEKILSPITFALKDFKTRDEGGGFTLAAASDDNERFEWKGSLSLQPVSSKGQFKVAGFKATSAYEFLSAELPFQLTQGSFDVDGSYQFSILPKQGMQLIATLPKISSKDLSIRAKKAESDWVIIPSLALANTQLNYQKKNIRVDSLTLEGVQASVWLEPDGSLNIERLFADSSAPVPTPVIAVAKPKPTVASTDWTASIAKLGISKATIDLEDRTVKPVGKFQLSPTEFNTSNLSLDLNKPLQISVDTTINGKAPLHVEGSVVPEAVTADLAIALTGMPMNQLLMYMPDYPGLELKSGMVAAKGQLLMDEKANIAYKGQAVVDDFKMVDTKNKADFLSWNKVTVDGIDYRQGPEKVAIDSIVLNKPFMEVVVTPQQTINIIDLLNSSTEATKQSGAKEAAADIPILVKKMQFQAGTMAFADYSIQPNFRAKIENLTGHVDNVSTDTNAVADIDLTGHIINKFSPVEIKGTTKPLAYDNQTDIKMAFRNIELPVFNPYSGRFAGYAIAKGKLTTELHYKIDNRKLAADHHVILNQLTWGEATDSKEKVSLPIRLATSLLKDKNGVIDLNLPVTGTLDDPKFRIGPIVWQVIKNIIVKVVTAPFSFIGSLFAGADDAQFVDFAPGSALLVDSAQKSLPILAKALTERQGVNLDIPAGTLAELDKAALSEQQFQTALSAVLGKKGKVPPAYASLEPKQQIAALEELYKLQFGKKPDIPKAEATPVPDQTKEVADASWKEKRAAKKSAEVEWLEAQLKPKFQASDAELVALGKARGEAVQAALLSSGELDPARVFLATNVPLQAHEGKVRMELVMK
jgi:hypothetical protein